MTQDTFRNVFPSIRTARYNVAAWKHATSGHLILVGRDVVKAGGFGEPDIGLLVLSEFDDQGNLVHEREIWRPQSDNFLLEDPRALVKSDGQIDIGLTVVLGSKSSFDPYPAIVKLSTSWEGGLPPVTVIQNFGPGKNTTPIGHDRFLFRPETPDYNHKLLLFEMSGTEPKRIADIIFPDNLPWAKWRTGTTMPPLWMDDGTALFIMHGISLINGKDVYSIGLAKLVPKGDGYEVIVDPTPLLTPDTFTDKEGKGLVEELRPDEKRVVYACGGVIDPQDKEHVRLFVNVGDRATFEVKFDLPELLRRLKVCEDQRTAATVQSQL